MVYHPKARNILAVLVALVFFGQGCATVTQKWGQKIPITSNPMGARIIVDGKQRGETPMQLTLARKQKHLIRIEMEGYDPAEISIGRKKSPWRSIVGNLIIGGFPIGAVSERIWGEAVSRDKSLFGEYFWYGFIAGFVAFMAVDVATGSWDYLSPRKVVVDLERSGPEPRTRVMYLDSDQLQNITSISIRCAGSEDRLTVNLR